MSAFWIRKRNFILALFLGMLLGGIFILLTSFLIRGKINTLVNGEQEEKVVLGEVLALNKALKKGELIKKEDLCMMQVEKSVENPITEGEVLGQKAKINIHDAIPLTRSMIGESLAYDDRDRLYEFSFIKLPRELETGDFVDVRIRMHNGLDYVVASNKQVSAIEPDEVEIGLGLIELPLNEVELLSISSAFVDSYVNDLTEVYLDRYIDGRTQKKSTVNYPINKDVASLLADNPNVIKAANIEDALKQRLALDENLKKVVFENNKLINYEIAKKAGDDIKKDVSEAGGETENEQVDMEVGTEIPSDSNDDEKNKLENSGK